jgi:hypothetical protein
MDTLYSTLRHTASTYICQVDLLDLVVKGRRAKEFLAKDGRTALLRAGGVFEGVGERDEFFGSKLEMSQEFPSAIARVPDGATTSPEENSSNLLASLTTSHRYNIPKDRSVQLGRQIRAE